MNIRKGDNVIIISGRDRKKTGKVVKTFPKRGLVLIEGINILKKHARPSKQGQKGQMVDKPMPLPVSKVMLVDSSGKGTRVGKKRVGGGFVRIGRRSGKEI